MIEDLLTNYKTSNTIANNKITASSINQSQRIFFLLKILVATIIALKIKKAGIKMDAATCVHCVVSPANVDLSMIRPAKQTKITITQGET